MAPLTQGRVYTSADLCTATDNNESNRDRKHRERQARRLNQHGARYLVKIDGGDNDIRGRGVTNNDVAVKSPVNPVPRKFRPTPGVVPGVPFIAKP